MRWSAWPARCLRRPKDSKKARVRRSRPRISTTSMNNGRKCRIWPRKMKANGPRISPAQWMAGTASQATRKRAARRPTVRAVTDRATAAAGREAAVEKEAVAALAPKAVAARRDPIWAKRASWAHSAPAPDRAAAAFPAAPAVLAEAEFPEREAPPGARGCFRARVSVSRPPHRRPRSVGKMALRR